MSNKKKKLTRKRKKNIRKINKKQPKFLELFGTICEKPQKFKAIAICPRCSKKFIDYFVYWRDPQKLKIKTIFAKLIAQKCKIEVEKNEDKWGGTHLKVYYVCPRCNQRFALTGQISSDIDLLNKKEIRALISVFKNPHFDIEEDVIENEDSLITLKEIRSVIKKLKEKNNANPQHNTNSQ